MTAADRAPWYFGPGSAIGAGLVSTLASTWRLERAPGYDRLDAELRSSRPCILAFWHARMLPLAWTHRHRGVVVLVSRHRDGEWIARVLERLGSATARGSSTRGGDVALKAMLRHAAKGRTLGVTPDGPRGPAERVKSGLVYVASRTGLPVVPLTMAADRAWVLRSWDRFRIPQPFARVLIAYGAPVQVPRDLDETGVETWRERIEQAMERTTRETAQAVGEPPAPPLLAGAPVSDSDAAGRLERVRPEDAA